MTIFKKILTTLFALHSFALISVHASAHSDSPEDPLLGTRSAVEFPPYPFFIDSASYEMADWWIDKAGKKDFNPVFGVEGLQIKIGRSECIDFNASIPALIIKLPDGTSLDEVGTPKFTIAEDPIGCCAKKPLSYTITRSYTITITTPIRGKDHTSKISKFDKSFLEKIFSAKTSAKNPCWRWEKATLNLTKTPISLLYIVFPGH